MSPSGSPSWLRSAWGPTRVLVALAGLVVVMLSLIGVYAMLASLVLHGPVNERSLFQSVSSVAGSAFSDVGGPCEKDGGTPNAAWSCTIYDRAGSGTVRYRVTVRPQSSCWEATLVFDPSEDGMPETLSGCVRKLEWSPL